MGPVRRSIVSPISLSPSVSNHVLMYCTPLDPPSPNVTLDTDLNFGVLAPQQPVGDVVSTIDGPFCYMYI